MVSQVRACGRYDWCLKGCKTKKAPKNWCFKRGLSTLGTNEVLINHSTEAIGGLILHINKMHRMIIRTNEEHCATDLCFCVKYSSLSLINLRYIGWKLVLKGLIKPSKYQYIGALYPDLKHEAPTFQPHFYASSQEWGSFHTSCENGLIKCRLSARKMVYLL